MYAIYSNHTSPCSYLFPLLLTSQPTQLTNEIINSVRVKVYILTLLYPSIMRIPFNPMAPGFVLSSYLVHLRKHSTFYKEG